MAQNTNQRTDDTSKQSVGSTSMPSKPKSSQNSSNQSTPDQIRDPNQVKDPNREARKGGDEKYPGRVIGKSMNDVNRSTIDKDKAGAKR